MGPEFEAAKERLVKARRNYGAAESELIEAEQAYRDARDRDPWWIKFRTTMERPTP